MNTVFFNIILFIISCNVILAILWLFSWIIEDNYLKPKKNIFSGGETGDIIVERSNGMKEKITKAYIRANGKWVEILNAEGVCRSGRKWRYSIFLCERKEK